MKGTAVSEAMPFGRAFVLLCSLPLVVAVGGVGPAAGWLSIRSPAAGYELRYPAGWHAAHGSNGVVVVVVGSAPIAPSELDRFRPSRLPGSASIWFLDYGQPHGRLPSLPRPLRLPLERTMEGFGPASTLSFELHGHQFQILAAFGAGASERIRALALRTIETLRTTATALPNRWHARVLGHSVQGRPIRVYQLGNPHSTRRLLAVGCIHGDECAGMAITLQLLNDPFGIRIGVWVVQDLNPDGLHADRRTNAAGVDLNRNFPAGWRPIRTPAESSGPRPFSEPETRIARHLIEQVRPTTTIWFHQPANLVRAWGSSIPAARRYAHLVGLPFHALPWLAGTAPNWQNHRSPGGVSFVVELPPGPLSLGDARRHAHATVRLAG